jgi:hypothetical protein
MLNVVAPISWKNFFILINLLFQSHIKVEFVKIIGQKKRTRLPLRVDRNVLKQLIKEIVHVIPQKTFVTNEKGRASGLKE